jgi:hypothetical protein
MFQAKVVNQEAGEAQIAGDVEGTNKMQRDNLCCSTAERRGTGGKGLTAMVVFRWKATAPATR